MAILTIMATSHTATSSTSTWSTLGFVLLAIGLVATFFSSRRYLLGYLISGMGYWVVVEGIQSILVNMTALSNGFGYAAALLITWIALAGFVGYRYAQFVKPNRATVKRGVEPLTRRSLLDILFTKIIVMRKAAKAAKQPEKYIEHTPVYNNYKPRFRN